MGKWLFGMGALLAGFFGSAQAQTMVPSQSAPAEWVRYAGQMEKAFEDKLGGDSDQAKRLRLYFASAGTDDVVAVGAWVAPDGKISRVAFAPFLDTQANADLASLLQDVKLTSNPPRDIRLPVRLKLHVGVEPRPTTGRAADTVAGH